MNDTATEPKSKRPDSNSTVLWTATVASIITIGFVSLNLVGYPWITLPGGTGNTFGWPLIYGESGLSQQQHKHYHEWRSNRESLPITPLAFPPYDALDKFDLQIVLENCLSLGGILLLVVIANEYWLRIHQPSRSAILATLFTLAAIVVLFSIGIRTRYVLPLYNQFHLIMLLIKYGVLFISLGLAFYFITRLRALRTERPWYQYSLRSLLIFMLVSGLFFGWVGKKVMSARKQNKIVEWVEVNDGMVSYDFNHRIVGIYFTGTQVSKEEVQKLQKELPNCTIEWDGE